MLLRIVVFIFTWLIVSAVGGFLAFTVSSTPGVIHAFISLAIIVISIFFADRVSRVFPRNYGEDVE